MPVGFSARVEKLRPLVESEISTRGYPYPSNLLLALISYESGGRIGVVNPESGASGLTQVMPITLRDYNIRTGDRVSLSSLRGNTDQDAINQVKVGAWVLGHYWRLAYAWLMNKNKGAEIEVKDLSRFADAFYAAGPGRIKEMTAKSGPIDWDSWTKKYPNSNITAHANRVLGLAEQNGLNWDLEAVDRWVTNRNGKPIQPYRPPTYGILLAALIISIALFFILKNEEPRKDLQHAKK